MRLIVTLRKDLLQAEIIDLNDCFLLGGPFSLYSAFTLNDLEKIIPIFKKKNKKVYIALDDLINERDLHNVNNYLNKLVYLNIDGLVVGDLGALAMAKSKGFTLFFDGQALLANSIDSTFFASQDIIPVLANELNLAEIKKIAFNNNGKVVAKLLGRYLIAISKRKYLSYYFKHEELPYDQEANYAIQEERRDHKLPIIENISGSRIYSNEIVLALNEIQELSIDYILFNTETLNPALVKDILKAYHKQGINEKDIIDKYRDLSLGKGYLYARDE